MLSFPNLKNNNFLLHQIEVPLRTSYFTTFKLGRVPQFATGKVRVSTFFRCLIYRALKRFAKIKLKFRTKTAVC